MKKTKMILALALIASLSVACVKNLCSGTETYKTFTKEELSNIWINIDSALYFEQKLNKSTYTQYNEFDTLKFTNQSGDTLNFAVQNTIRPEHGLCNNYPMIGISYFMPLKDCLIKELTLQMEKTLDTNKSVIFSFEFKLDDISYSSNYKIGDTIKLDYSYNNGKIDPTGKTYINVINDNITIANKKITNCLKFQFLDKQSNEILKIYYSNQYGFIKIIKDKQYEITRLF